MVWIGRQAINIGSFDESSRVGIQSLTDWPCGRNRFERIRDGRVLTRSSYEFVVDCIDGGRIVF